MSQQIRGVGVTAAAVPVLQRNAALFLDLDGTLVDFADDPDAVRVDAALRHCLARCAEHLDGALALVSGRSIEQVDRCFAPARFAVAGLHGLEWRDAGGRLHRCSSLPALRQAALRLQAALGAASGVRIEDKGPVLAIHYRAAPERAEELQQMARTMLDELGASYRLLDGAAVIELLPRIASKGSAVRAFMAQSPFRGRSPVFVGDDLTDLDGFQAARELGGHGVAVGPRVAAEFALPDVAAVRQWLTLLP